MTEKVSVHIDLNDPDKPLAVFSDGRPSEEAPYSKTGESVGEIEQYMHQKYPDCSFSGWEWVRK